MIKEISTMFLKCGMTDNLSKEKRSKVMASIKDKDTKPELLLRKHLWARGMRYRIHDKTIFGNPDISNKKMKLAIFVDGCFWHGCERCYRKPKSNVLFWKNKLARNMKRRMKVKIVLKNDGWRVLEFWEHQINQKPEYVAQQIARNL